MICGLILTPPLHSLQGFWVRLDNSYIVCFPCKISTEILLLRSWGSNRTKTRDNRTPWFCKNLYMDGGGGRRCYHLWFTKDFDIKIPQFDIMIKVGLMIKLKQLLQGLFIQAFWYPWYRPEKLYSRIA